MMTLVLILFLMPLLLNYVEVDFLSYQCKLLVLVSVSLIFLASRIAVGVLRKKFMKIAFFMPFLLREKI